MPCLHEINTFQLEKWIAVMEAGKKKLFSSGFERGCLIYE